LEAWIACFQPVLAGDEVLQVEDSLGSGPGGGLDVGLEVDGLYEDVRNNRARSIRDASCNTARCILCMQRRSGEQSDEAQVFHALVLPVNSLRSGPRQRWRREAPRTVALWYPRTAANSRGGR